MDLGLTAKAGEYLERLKSVKGWEKQERAGIEVAFFESYTGQRPAGLVDQYSAQRGCSTAGLRMEAMALLSDGYTKDAVERLEESKKSLASDPKLGWAIFEDRLLARVEEKIREASTERRAKPSSNQIWDVTAIQLA